MFRALWRFRTTSCRTVAQDQWSLSRPLHHWSKQDAWTVGDSVTGTFISGGTGSGKTSGSGRALVLAMLRAGYGGLVLTAKPDEVGLWKRYCREVNRESHLIVIEPGGSWRFNPLDFEIKRPGVGAGLVENIVAMFSAVLELADRGGSATAAGGGGDDNSYWRRSMKQLIRNLAELHIQATGSISFDSLYRAVISAPTSAEQAASEAWQKSSYCFKLLKTADGKPKSPEKARDLALVADYVLLEFANLSEKTRSIIVSTMTSLIDPLQRSPLREMFGSDTTVTPQDSEEGKIIVVATDTKLYGDVGVIANAIMKHAWQKSIERRNTTTSPRPCFLWMDEAQTFISSADMMFATTCRSSRVAMVLLTQNISNLHAALGGNEKGKAETNSLLANCNTKLAHAQSDPTTNEWFSALAGRTRQIHMNGSSSHQTTDWLAATMGTAQPGQTSNGFSEALEFAINPSFFTKLRTGGTTNRGIVDAVLFQNGRLLKASGKTWMSVGFQQEGLP